MQGCDPGRVRGSLTGGPIASMRLTPIDPPRSDLDADTTAAIVEAASMLIVVLDRDARVSVFNAACQLATGYTAEEMLGQPVWRLVPDDQRSEVDAVFR